MKTGSWKLMKGVDVGSLIKPLLRIEGYMDMFSFNKWTSRV